MSLILQLLHLPTHGSFLEDQCIPACAQPPRVLLGSQSKADSPSMLPDTSFPLPAGSFKAFFSLSRTPQPPLSCLLQISHTICLTSVLITFSCLSPLQQQSALEADSLISLLILCFWIHHPTPSGGWPGCPLSCCHLPEMLPRMRGRGRRVSNQNRSWWKSGPGQGRETVWMPARPVALLWDLLFVLCA